MHGVRDWSHTPVHRKKNTVDIIADPEIPGNLCDAETIPNWLEFEGVLNYFRMSPSQSANARYTVDWQSAYLQNFAASRDIPIVASYQDISSDSRRIGLKSRPQLFQAIEHARQTGCPILAFEYRRFTREPRKLKRFSDVRFVSLTPLGIPAALLDRHCKREANKLYRLENPDRIGGRPKNNTFDKTPWSTFTTI